MRRDTGKEWPIACLNGLRQLACSMESAVVAVATSDITIPLTQASVPFHSKEQVLRRRLQSYIHFLLIYIAACGSCPTLYPCLSLYPCPSLLPTLPLPAPPCPSLPLVNHSHLCFCSWMSECVCVHPCSVVFVVRSQSVNSIAHRLGQCYQGIVFPGLGHMSYS